ncbi:93_t:CDS:1 [Acaulospora morrowiae]|uniref:Succinate dehydrogenase assembly factor 2, mitochondrial n=1 Tax=Acaulospora morrowiae TaxID=94023 RepID=A0A9N9DYH3_9GLOM|nr:93_t:CDS:1 [Acaulospora morrowiae]
MSRQAIFKNVRLVASFIGPINLPSTIIRNLSSRNGKSNPSPLISQQHKELGLSKISRPNETINQKRSRLIYQSRKRGILETDLILSTFAQKYLHEFSEQELQEYDELLDSPDWDIYYFVIGKKPVPQRWSNSDVFRKLHQHVKNEGKVILRMPDL